MNLILKEDGFLDGSPGAYRVTEKGQHFADERDFHRGTGGYPSYNAHWSERTWVPSIVHDLNITDERIHQAREAARAARQQKAELRAAAAAQLDSDDTDDAETNRSVPDIRKVLLLAALAAGSIYAVIKVAPRVKRLWIDRAAPSLKKLRNGTAGDTTDSGEHTPT